MLTVLSPAKSLDFETPPATRKHSYPELVDRAGELIDVLVTKTPGELAQLMDLSPALTELNLERYADWVPDPSRAHARAAILAFSGDVYVGMDAPATFGERDYTHAQKTLRILSGLYGVLRPLDLILPYRLEMGSRLTTERGANLYQFWGDTITEHLRSALDASTGTRVLVNLASQEYFGAVRPDLLDAPVVTPTFLDAKGDGPPKVVSFFAKRARGAMAGWMVQNRISSASRLREFDRLGYRLDPDRSDRYNPVFTRRTDSVRPATP